MTHTDHKALSGDRYIELEKQVAAIRDLETLGDASITKLHLQLAELWDHLQVIYQRNRNLGKAYRAADTAAHQAHNALNHIRRLHDETGHGKCVLCNQDYPCGTVQVIANLIDP